MPITGIDAVVFGVEDMPTAVRFLDDWGLKRTGPAEYECRDRSRIVVEPVNTTGPKPIEAGPTTRAVIWGASDARTVETIASDLARDRKVTTDADGTAWAEDDMGLRIGIRVT